MELSIYWTEFAEEKLEDIFYYYKYKAGVKTARKIVTGIINQTIDLDKNPEIGQQEELLKGSDKTFRYLIYSNYKIIYWINHPKRRLEIITVYDTRQNPEKINL
ncbi:type II toxin-antitoxin system RelE/ParE family toxin [Flavobacterium sp. Sd200]|uniref:type II toxin-antitoxin system RelE/ParE family toxin n=1 Tax=Flavobacterium sp. Sd200 TaxID=2692211 RepID=UPI00137205D8|nr:type II toxin-antitoxin system RelE/ParE family toxin [Flavobacterium sp. Sd200]MXN92166.1 type II toxin-antitoxin system RelE/ParE family toxin [Flavobacterium sp. Sd200]